MLSSSFIVICSSVLSLPNIVASCVFLLVYYLVSFYQKQRTLYRNIPPGPKPWPVVGNFGNFFVPPSVRTKIGDQPNSTNAIEIEALSHQARIYGNMHSLFIGSQLIVVLHGFDLIRDALLNHPEVFSDRPDIPLVTILTKRKGKQLAKKFNFENQESKDEFRLYQLTDRLLSQVKCKQKITSKKRVAAKFKFIVF